MLKIIVWGTVLWLLASIVGCALWTIARQGTRSMEEDGFNENDEF